MTIRPRINSLLEIENMFKESLAKAGITQWNSDSIVRSLYQPMAMELDRLNRETEAAFGAIQFQSAEGEDLEQIAANYGVARRLPARAFSRSYEQNVTFYCDENFGSINGGSSITIPKGTRITTGTSEDSVPVVYETDQVYVLQANENRRAVGVSAITIGSSQNVGKNSLLFHNFTNYRDSSANTLKVTNIFPILNGEGIENDESLRYKIFSRYSTLVRESRNSILLDAMDVSGVEDIKVVPGYYGIGTLGVFVFGPEGLTSESILNEVGERIKASNPPGTRLIVRNGIANYLDMEITLWVPSGLSSEAYSDYRRIAKEEYLGFVKTNAKSKNLNFENLKRRILQRVRGKIGVMSEQEEDKIFDAIYIRKDYGEKLVTSSERIKILKMSYGMGDEEYLKAGNLVVNFDLLDD